MSDKNLLALYSQKIIELAMSIPFETPIDPIDAHASRRAPICGSRISINLRLDGDRIAAFHQDIQACALGQASAAILGQNIEGCHFDQISDLVTELEAFLKNGAPPPKSPFEDYAFLIAAQDFPNRHDSILLAPRATYEAFSSALSK